MDQLALIFYFGLIITVAYNILNYFTKRTKHELLLVVSSVILLYVWASRGLGLSTTQMGLSYPIKGIVIGITISIIIALAIYVLSNISLTKKYFEDSRTMAIPKNTLLYRLLFQIPISTVLIEELLFRGILYGYFEAQYSYTSAIIASSILFGIWHILPSITFHRSNKNSHSLVVTILTSIAFTAASGILFALLRHFTGSIYAPAILHYAVNSSSLIASWYNSSRK